MISGCYVLRLECDAFKKNGDRCGMISDFNGESKSDAIKVAMASGWRVLAGCCWCRKHSERSFDQRVADRKQAWRDV